MEVNRKTVVVNKRGKMDESTNELVVIIVSSGLYQQACYSVPDADAERKKHVSPVQIMRNGWSSGESENGRDEMTGMT